MTRSPRLTPHVVLFVDTLGTKNLGDGPDAEADLGRLKHALKESRDGVFRTDGADGPYKLKAFTDNIVLAWPLADGMGDAALGITLFEASYFQFMMTISGFFTRGGVSAGDCFIDDEIVFGPALNESYRTEQRVTYPCVALSASACALVGAYSRAWYGSLSKSDFLSALLVGDGQFVFLDYLSILHEGDTDEWFHLRRHAQVVREKMLSTTDRRARKKLRWVAEYHNHFVRTNYPDYGDALIKLRGSRHTFDSIASHRSLFARARTRIGANRPAITPAS